MHLFTHVRAKVALLFVGAFLWGAQAYADDDYVNIFTMDFETESTYTSGWTIGSKTTAYYGSRTVDSETSHFLNLKNTGSGNDVNTYTLNVPDLKNATKWKLDFDFAGYNSNTKSSTNFVCFTVSQSSGALLSATFDAAWTAPVTVADGSGNSLGTIKCDLQDKNTRDADVAVTVWHHVTLIDEGSGVYCTITAADGTTEIASVKIAETGVLPTGFSLRQCNALSQWAIDNVTIDVVSSAVFAPSITYEGETYTSNLITLASKTSGATIQYTLNDGETQTYSEPFRIYETTKITATAVKGDVSSDSYSETITAGFVVAPTITITGVNGGGRTVEFASTTAGASTQYTTADDETGVIASKVDISETTTFTVIATLSDVYTNETFKSSATTLTVEAGVKVQLAGVTYSANGTDVTFTADQSSVLCKPTAEVTYSFIPVDEITGEKGEVQTGTVESGKSVSLGYGLLSATASADGYADSDPTSAEYKPLDLKAVDGRSWDFTQYSGSITEGSAKLTVSGLECNQLTIGGTAVEDIYTQANWTFNATNGIQNYTGGDRFIVVDNVKKGQVIRLTLVQGSEALTYSILVNGTQDLNSTTNVWVFNVIEDGTFAVKLHRYNYVKSIEVSEDLSASRTISYDAVTGYATFYWNKTIEIPSGVKAYTGELNEGKDALNLTEIEGKYIPALTPAILVAADRKGESDVVTEAEDVEVEAISSSLKGILIAQTASEYVTSGQVYVLSRKEDASSIGFYKFSGETLAANKAYLVVDAASNAPMVRFNFDEGNVGNVTGIESIEAENGAQARIFDLQGRSLRQAPQKGMYILNGHKVIR